jgi:anti-sigma regulatory factor (Ser/Thr protein kinase)
MRSTVSDDADQPLAEVSVTLPATAENLATVYATLAQFWTELESRVPTPPDATWRAYFDTAVGEIVSNIVRYAYSAAASDGEMSVVLLGFPDRVEATFRDRGVPYAGSPIGDARMPPDSVVDVLDLPEGGWGLAMTLAAVDDLQYTREADINSWRFMKKL